MSREAVARTTASTSTSGAVSRSTRPASVGSITAISVTIRFDDQATGAPVGLTVVILKPDRFRVVVESGGR